MKCAICGEELRGLAHPRYLCDEACENISKSIGKRETGWAVVTEVTRSTRSRFHVEGFQHCRASDGTGYGPFGWDTDDLEWKGFDFERAHFDPSVVPLLPANVREVLNARERRAAELATIDDLLSRAEGAMFEQRHELLNEIAASVRSGTKLTDDQIDRYVAIKMEGATS